MGIPGRGSVPTGIPGTGSHSQQEFCPGRSGKALEHLQELRAEGVFPWEFRAQGVFQWEFWAQGVFPWEFRAEGVFQQEFQPEGAIPSGNSAPGDRERLLGILKSCGQSEHSRWEFWPEGVIPAGNSGLGAREEDSHWEFCPGSSGRGFLPGILPWEFGKRIPARNSALGAQERLPGWAGNSGGSLG